MNILNCSFWSAYGLAKMDPVIYAPNLIGLALGVMQGILCMLYPRQAEPEGSSDLRQPLLENDGEEQLVEGASQAEAPTSNNASGGAQIVMV